MSPSFDQTEQPSSPLPIPPTLRIDEKAPSQRWIWGIVGISLLLIIGILVWFCSERSSEINSFFAAVRARKHLQVQQMLVDHPYLANCRFRIGGVTALHVAAINNDDRIVMLLLYHDADINARDKNGATPFFYAALAGSVLPARRLIEQGGNFRLAIHNGSTPLHAAAGEGYDVIVNMLLDHGVDANVRTLTEMTPLHAAALNGWRDVVIDLLRHGADPNLKDKKGRTPVDWARARNHPEIVELLTRQK